MLSLSNIFIKEEFKSSHSDLCHQGSPQAWNFLILKFPNPDNVTQSTPKALAVMGNCVTIKRMSNAFNYQDCVVSQGRI